MKLPENIKIYGDLTHRDKKCPKESAEQITFFNELRKKYPHVAKCAAHMRNEGKRTIHQASKEKAEGMNAGFADIVIAGCPTLLIELKRRDHTLSTIGNEQLEHLLAAQSIGAKVCVALGWEAAMRAVEEWLSAAR